MENENEGNEHVLTKLHDELGLKLFTCQLKVSKLKYPNDQQHYTIMYCAEQTYGEADSVQARVELSDGSINLAIEDESPSTKLALTSSPAQDSGGSKAKASLLEKFERAENESPAYDAEQPAMSYASEPNIAPSNVGRAKRIKRA